MILHVPKKYHMTPIDLYYPVECFVGLFRNVLHDEMEKRSWKSEYLVVRHSFT